MQVMEKKVQRCAKCSQPSLVSMKVVQRILLLLQKSYENIRYMWQDHAYLQHYMHPKGKFMQVFVVHVHIP